jgi:hypothetical protein
MLNSQKKLIPPAWQRVDDPYTNTIELTVESAWRRSFSRFFHHGQAAVNPSLTIVLTATISSQHKIRAAIQL